jgi:hypothetical protein
VRHAKRLVLVTGLVCALIVPSAASAAGGPVGTYATTITKSNHLNGRWVLVLAKGGTYAVAQNGETLARGTYATAGMTITLGREPASGCRGSGTYVVKTSGATVAFVRKREHATCRARAEILGHPFKRVR